MITGISDAAYYIISIEKSIYFMSRFSVILNGTVVRGKGRGKKLGFPTANLEIKQEFDIDGVFLAFVHINEKRYPSLFFSGYARTFEQKQWTHEVYILDFSKDIYGKEISLEILEKLRDNKKFSSREELIQQIEKDEKHAKKILEFRPRGLNDREYPQ